MRFIEELFALLTGALVLAGMVSGLIFLAKYIIEFLYE